MPDLNASTSADSFPNKRTVPRYSLIATVEITEPESDIRLSGRLSEISRKGCYVDILNTLPAATMIRLRVSRDRGTFTTAGKIIYVQEGMGMGVAFVDPPPDELKTLESWLAELES